MSVSAQNIDFSKVKDGGNFNKKRIPAGDYAAKITKVEDAPVKADNTPQYLFTIKVEAKAYASSVFPYYCKIQENQLWKLRNILIAGGIPVPKKRMKVDPSKLVGKTIGISVEDDEYEGKEQSVIQAVFPAAELTDDAPFEDDDEGEDSEEEYEEAEEAEEEAEEDAEDEAEEDEEEADEDPYAALDRAELKALLKERDPAFVAKKSQEDEDLRDLLRAGDSGELDEPEEEEAEEEGEVVAPPKRAVAKKKPVARKKPAAEVSDEELEELDIDDI